MRWRSVLLAIALIGVPAIAAAQGPPDSTGPHTMAATMHGGADGGAMACPMMGQHSMHMGAMRGMTLRGEDRGGAPGMGRSPMEMMGTMAMMGMMPMAMPDADPKAQARWMQLRGEMMKAVGDVLIRHGRELDSGK